VTDSIPLEPPLLLTVATINAIQTLKASPFYQSFCQDVCKEFAQSLERPDDIGKIATALSVIKSEKIKLKKGKEKPKSKKSSLGGTSKGSDKFGAYGQEEYDDFM
jgi:hypothetical protein